MHYVTDIREYKSALRDKYKSYRKSLDTAQKSAFDEKIYARLISTISYRNAQTVFCYVSTEIEVDTHRFIEKALADGKMVAVPRCIENTRQMDFHYISSLSELHAGTFGVSEPDDTAKIADIHSDNSLCIVPGLCFDKKGYRLGYGKGYYDRFLSEYTDSKIGICYAECITDELTHGKYDCKSDLVITERGFIIC